MFMHTAFREIQEIIVRFFESGSLGLHFLRRWIPGDALFLHRFRSVRVHLADASFAREPVLTVYAVFLAIILEHRRMLHMLCGLPCVVAWTVTNPSHLNEMLKLEHAPSQFAYSEDNLIRPELSSLVHCALLLEHPNARTT